MTLVNDVSFWNKINVDINFEKFDSVAFYKSKKNSFLASNWLKNLIYVACNSIWLVNSNLSQLYKWRQLRTQSDDYAESKSYRERKFKIAKDKWRGQGFCKIQFNPQRAENEMFLSKFHQVFYFIKEHLG